MDINRLPLPFPPEIPLQALLLPILPSDGGHPLQMFLGHNEGDATMFEELERLRMGAGIIWPRGGPFTK